MGYCNSRGWRCPWLEPDVGENSEYIAKAEPRGFLDRSAVGYERVRDTSLTRSTDVSLSKMDRFLPDS